MKEKRYVDLFSIARKAMEKYGFYAGFPAAVISEVNALREEEVHSRSHDLVDLRHLLWSSIDNADSMDLDQVEFCEMGPGGVITVAVAIADVDLFVPLSSHIDRYAAHNGTSVYTGVETFPMLPDRLSKGLSSLLPDHDHVAVVLKYEVLQDGSIRHKDPFLALVRNTAKLIYDEVGAWLEGTSPLPISVGKIPGLAEQLQIQEEATKRLRKNRFEKGALFLETLEPEPVMEGGLVRDIILQRHDRARQVIEEFMVAANGTMTDYLEKAGLPMIQRIVRVPKNWDGIVRLASGRGEVLPASPDAKALSDFLIRQKEKDPEHFPDLSLAVVKLLGPGEYAAWEPGTKAYGHFALAVTDYTHATAPNRRYVDLVNQRLVKAALQRLPVPYSSPKLHTISLWLSDREKQSKKVERFMRKAAAALLLKERIGEVFDAVVTGASPKGTYVRLLRPPAEGRVTRGEQGCFVGQQVRVRLTETDPYNAFIDFERVKS